ncbi:MAG: ABC transporter permease, partial [Burkholderiaceae bacterium]
MLSGWFSDLLSGTRALRRDWRSGELRLLMLALIVAVAAVTSVGFLADRVARALERNSAQMLGGDLVLQADEPIPASFLDHALALGLDATQTRQFPSMVSSATQTQLASLKAVSPGYPLRGALRVSKTPTDSGASTHFVPD